MTANMRGLSTTIRTQRTLVWFFSRVSPSMFGEITLVIKLLITVFTDEPPWSSHESLPSHHGIDVRKAA